MAYSYDPTVEVREVYYGNITGGKIAFGYDYADKDTDIMPFSSEHGTHVAGIIGGYDDEIIGVAIDTQFAIMKVFSDYDEGAEDGDILAALEDSVVLKVDAINMSLGSSCGFTREVDEEYKNEVYDRIEAAGISLIVAASNDYSSGFGSEHGNTNKTDNPDSATVGSPSTYNAAFSVASIHQQGAFSYKITHQQTAFSDFIQSRTYGPRCCRFHCRHRRYAYSFNKMTLADDQVLKVYLYEEGGQRNLVMTISAKDINKAGGTRN
jgi:hypothetical protein